MTTVLLSDLIDGFYFANAGVPYENSAFIHLDTGAIHLKSSMIELEDEPPDDLETSDRYLAIPYKNELDLGRELALSFVDQELPGEYDKCADFFRRRGAYGRFKDFLESCDVLEKWYAFENQVTEDRLRAWCEEHGIQLSPEKPAT